MPHHPAHHPAAHSASLAVPVPDGALPEEMHVELGPLFRRQHLPYLKAVERFFLRDLAGKVGDLSRLLGDCGLAGLLRFARSSASVIPL
jgi:hypothetical protein